MPALRQTEFSVKHSWLFFWLNRVFTTDVLACLECILCNILRALKGLSVWSPLGHSMRDSSHGQQDQLSVGSMCPSPGFCMARIRAQCEQGQGSICDQDQCCVGVEWRRSDQYVSRVAAHCLAGATA